MNKRRKVATESNTGNVSKENKKEKFKNRKEDGFRWRRGVDSDYINNDQEEMKYLEQFFSARLNKNNSTKNIVLCKLSIFYHDVALPDIKQYRSCYVRSIDGNGDSMNEKIPIYISGTTCQKYLFDLAALNESWESNEVFRNKFFNIITGDDIKFKKFLGNLHDFFILDNGTIEDVNRCIDRNSSAYHTLKIAANKLKANATEVTEAFRKEYYHSEQWLISHLSEKVIDMNYCDLTSQLVKETIIDRVPV
jgi:hypothetical protein